MATVACEVTRMLGLHWMLPQLPLPYNNSPAIPSTRLLPDLALLTVAVAHCLTAGTALMVSRPAASCLHGSVLLQHMDQPRPRHVHVGIPTFLLDWLDAIHERVGLKLILPWAQQGRILQQRQRW